MLVIVGRTHCHQVLRETALTAALRPGAAVALGGEAAHHPRERRRVGGGVDRTLGVVPGEGKREQGGTGERGAAGGQLGRIAEGRRGAQQADASVEAKDEE